MLACESSGFKRSCDKVMDLLSLSVPGVDHQHLMLVDSMLILHQAMLEKKGDTVVHKLLEDFKEMLYRHFEFEESFISGQGLKISTAHKVQHDLILEKFNVLIESSTKTKVGLSIRLMDFLYLNIFKHIKDFDVVYCRQLRSARTLS